MPAGIPHEERGESDSFANIVIAHDTDRFIVLGCHCWYDRPGAIPIKSCASNKAKYLSDLLAETADSFNHGSLVAPHLYRAYLGLILEEYERVVSKPKPGVSPMVARCMDLLFAELGSTDLSIMHIARQLNCNADSLSARFSREVGKTAIEYLTELRMEQAKRLLRETSLSIAEVAWASGYRDANYFSRLFKKQNGTTPRSFRRG
ncbi:helix-turn-helix transcriptional regulator [Pontiella agarivorans]|uniref:Helix-turn-helix transcriptional regulator n=1 Tax=Pontiella agarivorans TaxID=3038953 RepID=A0ABU5MW70_9BACT|nr:helix-turn-helix transcriptional regulator [Pontiella agarivorans]MDZ8118464.1 helix-turn-helix transcriptional regulator [Pontiella agarivorans]